MPTARGKVGLSPGERAQDSQKMLKRTFSKVKCLECGICCTTPGERHDVLVLANEPNKAQLRMVAGMKPGASVERRALGSFVMRAEGRCAMLDLAGREKRCSVYAFRPAICAAFPFMVQEVTNTGRDGLRDTRGMIVLTSMCPPLGEAKAAGVTYVKYEDLLLVVNGAGGARVEARIPALSESLIAVEACMAAGLLFSPSDFFRFSDMGAGKPGDMPVFPIM